MDGVRESHNFRHFETKRHYQDTEKHRPEITIKQSQPHKKPQRKNRKPKNCKGLMVQRAVASRDFVPHQEKQIKWIKGLSERIDIKRIPCGLSRRPKGEIKVVKTGQQIHFVFVIQNNKIISYSCILAIYWENVAKQI
ncbi:hypothetical protein ES703_81481 [subsurface metagenome]